MKKTKNQLAYEREVRRLTRFVKTAQKQGIIFLPGEPALPQSPARITQKRLRELQLMTRSDVLGRGYTVDTETGEVTQYKPKQSKKRYLSQIKPILTPTQAKKKRQEASRKGYQTRKINEILQKYKLPESVRDYVRKVMESALPEEEKQDFIYKYAHFYNPSEFPLKPPEQEPEPEKQPIEPGPSVPPSGEEPPEYYEVPDPDDFTDGGSVDGASVILDRLRSMLAGGQNENVRALINEKIDEKLAEEGIDAFISRISPSINRIMGIMYDIASKLYKEDDVREAAYDVLYQIMGEDPISLQNDIDEAAHADAYSYRAYRRD